MKINVKKGFTLIELLVVILILGILVAVALPAYLSSVKDARTKTADTNARALATAIQANYVRVGGSSYLDVIANGGGDGTKVTNAEIQKDMGGSIPVNPCTGTGSLTATDYTITSAASTATVTAVSGSNCNGTKTFTVGG